MSMEGRETENNLQEWSHGKFVNMLVEATKTHPISSVRLPKKINLEGALGNSFDQLIADTMADPERKERAKLCRVNFDSKLVMPKKADVGSTVGVSSTVNVAISRSLLGAQYTQREQLAFHVHTHGIVEAPPSPEDLSNVLRSLEDFGVQAEFVLTKEARMMILRTLSTPDLDRVNVETMVQEWERELKFHRELMEKVISDKDQLMKFFIPKKLWNSFKGLSGI